MSKELGWNSAYDEGVRLLAKTNGYTGIRINLQLPGEYACSDAESYFNFYLGFNEKPGFNPGRQIESGISFSAKGWQSFINDGGREAASSKMNFTGVSQIRMELSLTNKMLTLNAHGTPLKASFPIVSAAPKMIIALHESHKDLANRKVWFDEVVMTCTEVKVGEKWVSFPQSKLSFEQSVIDKKLIDSVITPSTLRATMKKPG